MQNTKLLTLFFFLYTAFITHAFAVFPTTSTITTAKSMQDIEQYASANTLVLFDLDHTVFEGKEYGYGHANWFYDQIEKGKAKGLEANTVLETMYPHWLYSQKTADVKPVEAITPEVIKKLQNKGFMVMGLTSRQLPLMKSTLRQLKGINVNFANKTFPNTTLELQTKAPTTLRDGTLFCADYNDKGEVLRAYMQHLNIHPQQIILIDDSMKNLQSVIKAYEGKAIVLGLYYPLVADHKKTHWNAKAAHQAYYDVYVKTPELKGYPLERD